MRRLFDATSSFGTNNRHNTQNVQAEVIGGLFRITEPLIYLIEQHSQCDAKCQRGRESAENEDGRRIA